MFIHSAEGDEFLVDQQVAELSGTIKMMINSSMEEASTREIKFPEISSQILSKVIDYLHFKKKHSNSTQHIPDFAIEPEIVAELLIASNYLDC